MTDKNPDKKPQSSQPLDQSPGYSPYGSVDDDKPKGPRGRPYFPLLVGGAAGGLLGVLAGHLVVVGLFNLDPKAGEWFKGPNGPPFFSLALSTALYYAFLGLGLFRGWARLKGACLGLGVAFLSFAVPMVVATRSLSYEMVSTAPAFSWVYLVLGLYAGAGAVALWAIGAFCGAGDEWVDWRAGFGAVGGAALSYMMLQILTAAFPSMHPATAPGLLPHKIALVDGLVSGALVGAAIAFTASIRFQDPTEEDHV